MERRLSRDETSDSSSSSDEEGDYNDHRARGNDDDSNHEHVLEEDRHYHKKTKIVESLSSNRAHHSASANDRKGSNVQQLARSGTSIVPSRKDVLLGRGRPYQNFGGNKRMLRIVSRYKDEYVARPRDQKRLFVETVLDAVLKDGTRFLRRVDESEDGSSDQWEEVDRPTAADKVWHALRSKDRSMKSKDKLKGIRQEGGGDDQSVVSRSSRVKSEEEQLVVSRETTSSSDGIGELVDYNVSSQPVQERSHERAGGSVSIPPTVESLTREITYHLNKAVEATNLLSALIGAPLRLPTASLPLTMLAGTAETGDSTRAGNLQARQQHDHSIVDDVAAMNNNAMFLPAVSSLGASAPSPVNSEVQSTAAPLLPFSSFAGLLPPPSMAQYLSTLSNVGVAAGGMMGPSMPATFPDARQIAQMAALYPRLYSGGNAPPVHVAASSNQLPPSSTATPAPTHSTTTTIDRSQQILLQALATLSRQAAQQGTGQSQGPPR